MATPGPFFYGRKIPYSSSMSRLGVVRAAEDDQHHLRRHDDPFEQRHRVYDAVQAQLAQPSAALPTVSQQQHAGPVPAATRSRASGDAVPGPPKRMM